MAMLTALLAAQAGGLVLPTPTPTCSASSVTLNISTGQAAGGSPDPYWRLIAAPTPQALGPALVVATPISSWASASPGSQWIGNPFHNAPGGDYVYEICWCQACPGGSVSLQAAADNSGQVSFTTSLNSTLELTIPGFSALTTPVTSFGPGTAGRNCLEVSVTNTDNPSPTGLLLEGTVMAPGAVLDPIGTGPCPVPSATPTSTATATATATVTATNTITSTPTATPTSTPTLTPTIAIQVVSLPPCQSPGQVVTADISTAVGVTPSQQDQQWYVLAAPNQTGPSQAYSTNPVAAWVTPTASDHWIQRIQNANPQTDSGGSYTFRLQIALNPAFYSSVQIAGQYSSDNTAAVQLNGITQSSCSGPHGNDCFSGWKSFNITSGFGNGLNTLDVVVFNQSNITGTIVEATLQATCLSPTPTRTPTATATATVTPPPCAQAPSGMVAWYPLDEQQGAVAVNDIAPPPSSLVNNVGTPQTGPVGMNGPLPVTGKVGAGALYFFTGNLVDVPPQTELDFNDFSLDAWVRAVGCGPGRFSPIVDKLDTGTNTGFSLYLDQPLAGNAVLELQLNASTFTSTAALLANANPIQNLGPWYHIAVTVDRTGPGGGTFYINGVPAGSFVPPAGTLINTLPMWIGEIRVPGARCEIAIDELELFNRALSAPEVQAIYNAGASGKCRVTPTPAATPTPTCAPPISVIISTGQSGSVGNPDALWQITAAPPNTAGFLGPGPATVIAPNGGWALLASTQWISANTSCSQLITGDCPGGHYLYRICWQQCGPLAPPAVLQVLADNTAQMFLDGNLLTTSPASIGFTSAATVQNFNPGSGLHMLRVDVTNSPYSNSACTGAGQPLACCTGPGTGACGTATGMDLSGVLNGSVQLVACPAPRCIGDCRERGAVTVDDILLMVNIALGNTDLTLCGNGDANSDGRISIDEILAAVNNALNGCSLI